jgi:hypothetical protein
MTQQYSNDVMYGVQVASVWYVTVTVTVIGISWHVVRDTWRLGFQPLARYQSTTIISKNLLGILASSYDTVSLT